MRFGLCLFPSPNDARTRAGQAPQDRQGAELFDNWVPQPFVLTIIWGFECTVLLEANFALGKPNTVYLEG